MARAEIKREHENYRLSLFYNNKHTRKEEAYYWNTLDKNPKKLCQILIDLHLEGFPIIEAMRLAKSRIDKNDWLGL